jgi:hypothetical protein
MCVRACVHAFVCIAEYFPYYHHSHKNHLECRSIIQYIFGSDKSCYSEVGVLESSLM